jgi:hypothetical protein
MEAVVLLNQRLSRKRPDRVSSWAERMNMRWEADLTLPFVRTAGDEMQALTASPTALVNIVVEAIEDGGWWTGAGIGNVEQPLGATTRDSRGEAFWLARKALEKAKAQRGKRPFALRSETPATTRDLSACLNGLAFIILRRTTRQREAATLMRQGATAMEIAERHSVTPQSVRQLLQSAGADEERELRELAERIAKRALSGK